MYLLILCFIVIAASAEFYNSTAPRVGSKGPYCYPESGFADCIDACPTPSSGATCDLEISGVNQYWCCHEPLPGCFSNSNDAKSHCSTGKVSKVDEYLYCCTMESCCHSGDKNCNTGDVCCDSGCNDPYSCSYTTTGCSNSYGAAHNCAWDSSNSACIAGIQ